MRYLSWPSRPSQPGWALLLLAIFVAAGLRFWQLGDIPPGLYRDEATNGLDAVAVLTGQRQGQTPFFFEANNGREPAYIYLAAASIRILGQTTFAVRLAAAVIGTLTTWFTFKLAESWFGRRVGLLSAWIWAITLWPIHLSRIGLRPILLPLVLSLTFWLGTLAYRRQRAGQPARWMWLAAGIVYGLSFYTYLATRFTLILFLLLVIYLVITGRGKWLWPGFGWSTLGAGLVLAPLIGVTFQNPELILGRAGQVSILNPAINNGDFLGTLARQLGQTLGMFGWQGDTIIRHNPPGRPVFDLVMLLFFLAGLVWCLREWRRGPAMTLLIWVGVMLGPTLLAEDAPHFLRAVGILPAALMLPAIGLSQLWSWSRLPARFSRAAVVFILTITLIITVKDYFITYNRQPETAYWFEAAARDLADFINNEPEDVQLFVDQRFRDSWPSIPFLIEANQSATYYQPDDLATREFGPPAVIYAWPYERLDLVTASIESPALVQGQQGSLAQGDLDPDPYPLFVRYAIDGALDLPTVAFFDNNIALRDAKVSYLDSDAVQVDLYWSTTLQEERQLISFVHVLGPAGLIGQSDTIPSQGNWPSQWWRSGLIIHDQHVIHLDEKLENKQPQIRVGLYNAYSQDNLPVADVNGEPLGSSWLLRP